MTIKKIGEGDREDLSILIGRIFNPSLMIIAPFVPFLCFSSLPASALFFLAPLLDFFSAPRKLCRTYIINFELAYVSLFVMSLALRVILEFVDIIYWSIPIVLLPFALLAWGKFSYQSWRILYEQAQLLGGENK